ncbi:GntR family transcriptional regulator [Marinivivus vitaminiproducens]|uniref:GntR family transcriptional regulator n=1 Tax=Marinivivus vitaminiproducens TaxID=3035935 RepID=UPI0027A0FFFA|nr:GntR family transcriptional regulator [Geminicoccaceae bacterium SCSIO 64248]
MRPQLGQPSVRRTLRKGESHAEATRRLRAMIVDGELPPGERLNEARLSETLGVSRTPVREALRTLAAEGLVEPLPNRSVVVAPLRAPDIEHLFRVFGTLEGLAGELACAAITPDELGEIGQMLSAMVELHGRADRSAYLAINKAIHRRVVEIAGNPILHSQWRALLPRMERARALANLDNDRWAAALHEHVAMYAALAARDGPRLARLTLEHFMNGLPSTLSRIERP